MTRGCILAVSLTFATLLAGCRDAPSEPAAAAEDPPAIAVTTWTGKTELFMEYPPLVAGQPARFAIHLTDLSSFEPLREGRVVVRFEGDMIQRFDVDSPSTPGIFGVDVMVPAARRYQVAVELHGAITDEHRVGVVTVYPDGAAALAAVPADEGEGAVSFLKEQQWTLDFATAFVDGAARRAVLEVPATIEPRAGGEADVRATTAGRIAAGRPRVAGSRVTQGEVLAELIARTDRTGEGPVLKLELSEARTAHRLAQANLARIERLVIGGAAPQRRLDEARAADETAADRVRIAEEQLRHFELTRSGRGSGEPGERVVLRAPITGIVAEADATNGATVEEGDRLFRIVALDRVHVVGAVPEQHLAQVQAVSAAEIAVPGTSAFIEAERLVSIGRVVDPRSRTVPVVFALTQPPPSVAIGQVVTLRLITTPQAGEVAIPASAVVDDGGQSIVFVQAGGESFERRPVKVGGAREGGYVQISEGLESGERIVTTGAHLVRLAALSPRTPGHGHVH